MYVGSFVALDNRMAGDLVYIRAVSCIDVIATRKQTQLSYHSASQTQCGRLPITLLELTLYKQGWLGGCGGAWYLI